MGVQRSETDVVVRLMGATTARAKVIAGNVANQNTPGYVRQVLKFEDRLQEALRTGKDVASVEPEIVLDTETPGRPDGNNVSLEVELNAMRENRILYETYATIHTGQFELLRSSIQYVT